MLMISSATVSEVDLAVAKMPFQKCSDPEFSFIYPFSWSPCVYDQDHLTSSAVSPCSGKAPVFGTVLTQKYTQYVRQPWKMFI